MRAIRTVLIGTILGIILGMAWVNIGKIYDELSGNSTNNYEEIEDVINLNTTNSVTESVIRFHIRANSNSKEDQQLKMAVKEGIISMIKPLLAESGSIEESKEIIEEYEKDISEVATELVNAYGYDYQVKVYMTEEEFPMKEYGDMVFPAGNYQALRIDIGEAEGDNWWCVMYPPLCFIDATNGVVPEESKEELKNILTEEEYSQLLLNGNNIYEEEIEVEVKLKIFEEIEKLKEIIR